MASARKALLAAGLDDGQMGQFSREGVFRLRIHQVEARIVASGDAKTILCCTEKGNGFMLRVKFLLL